MSKEYNEYLKKHKYNVSRAFYWIHAFVPAILTVTTDDLERQIAIDHDSSKSKQEEYGAYDAYFYGNDESNSVKKHFDRAWLNHIHSNPHHWQHWVLINDDPLIEQTLIDMPYNYILEMVCDWMSFGIEKGDLNELFKFYNDNKKYMMLSSSTRSTLEYILGEINKEFKRQGGVK